MAYYSNENILDLFVIYGRCDKIVQRTCREFNMQHPNLPTMNKQKFARIKKNFLHFGKVRPTCVKTKVVIENEENQVNVLAYFGAFPRASIRTAATDLGLGYSSIQRILRMHKLHPYSFISLQKLRPTDLPRRIGFCEELLMKIQEDPNILRRIIWTDEAKFCQRGVFNRRNRHFWAYENPRLVIEVENQVQFSINVFCLMMNNRVHYYMYDENLNTTKYLEILNEVIENFVDNLSLQDALNAWYQMDGAPAHSTKTVDVKLTSIFDDKWFGNKGPSLWPARSPDLTPLDFYLWGQIKDKVYINPPTTKENLKVNITQAFNQLDPAEIQRATNSAVLKRILECLSQSGGHIEHIFQ